MLILLPPSESKSAPKTPLAPSLSFDELDPVRRRVQSALIKMCSGNRKRAIKALALGPTQFEQVDINAQLDTAACGLAIDVYTGVIFEALAAHDMTAAQRTRLHAHVAIASGLYGLVRPLDAIAPYRLSAGSRVTSLPTLKSLWAAPIGGIFEDSVGPILDMRSQAYASLAPLPASCLERSIAVRVLQEQDGKRTVVSHFNKAAKGSLVSALVRRGAMASSSSALMQQLTSLDYEWEMAELPNSSMRLDIITRYTPGKVSTPRK